MEETYLEYIKYKEIKTILNGLAEDLKVNIQNNVEEGNIVGEVAASMNYIYFVGVIKYIDEKTSEIWNKLMEEDELYNKEK